MKKILLLETGGIRVSKHSEKSLSQSIEAKEILTYIPEIQKFCQAEALQICNMDSVNMEMEQWQLITDTIQEKYEEYDGFVIAHGTETMAYTAAALSYMIQNSRKPIVITGAQRSIDSKITDAKRNLADSFFYAADDASQGVQIVFGGKVIAGSRAKKIRSKSYNVFESMDYPYLAQIQEMSVIRYIPMQPYKESVKFYRNMNPKVFLLKIIPGISSKILRFLFEEYACIIVESLEMGGIPTSVADELYKLKQEFPKTVVIRVAQGANEDNGMTTNISQREVKKVAQGANEEIDMTRYEAGNKMRLEPEFLESYDMTLEAVVSKAMWMLGEGNIGDKTIAEAFYQQVNYDTMDVCCGN